MPRLKMELQSIVPPPHATVVQHTICTLFWFYQDSPLETLCRLFFLAEVGNELPIAPSTGPECGHVINNNKLIFTA